MEKTLPKMLQAIALAHPNTPAQYSKNKDGKFEKITYSEYFDTALNFGAGLLSLGIQRGDHIGLISDNRKEWQQADMGLLAIGAIDVPRGCDATIHDLQYILTTAECHTVIAENPRQIEKIMGIKDNLPLVDRIICFDPIPEGIDSKGVELLTFADIIQKGTEYRIENPATIEEELSKGQDTDLATLIFTSGTTGEPKGVMLTHGNFIAQLPDLMPRIYLDPGDIIICVLPIWHAFQRACEYVALSQAGALAYSKPVGSVLLADLALLNPQIMPAVPRVYEALYDGIMRAMRKTGGIVLNMFKFFLAVSKLQCRISRTLFRKKARFSNDYIVLKWILLFIPWVLLSPLKALGSALVFKKVRAKLGTSFRAGVSGGGAFPPVIDEFFWACGVKVVEGYGLTETSPVVAVRPIDDPIFGTVGKPLHPMEVRIVSDEDGSVLPAGKKGIVQVRGPIVMQGYYKRPDLTAKVIDKDGWFDTGDIGMLTLDGEIVLRGRMKDTIVLRGGENVEPLPIEMKLTESRYVSQVIVVGQDMRVLGALIIPSKDDLVIYARENYIPYESYRELLTRPEIIKMFENEIANLVNSKTGFKSFERVSCFTLLEKPFEVGVELSAKQEIMRYKVSELYAKQINAMFKEE